MGYSAVRRLGRERWYASASFELAILIASLYLLVAAQAASTPPDCKSGAPDEVVVCGSKRGESPYRLPKVPETYSPGDRKIRAETDIAPGVHASAHFDPATLPD